MIAEYAFCKHFNIFFDPTAYPRSGSADCVLKGKRFDVKATKYTNGKLVKTLKDNSDVDCYALAIVEENKVTFPGWALKEKLQDPDNKTNLGHGWGYAMPQSELTQWKDK